MKFNLCCIVSLVDRIVALIELLHCKIVMIINFKYIGCCIYAYLDPF